MYDAPVSFHFAVDFENGPPAQDNRFSEVSGITADVGTEELQEGGVNTYVHRLPTGASYGNLVLKRGMLGGSEVRSWCRNAIENFQFEPRDVNVTLLNTEHIPLMQWTFIRAWPVKWSISDLSAQDNALVVESLELAYRRFRKSFPA